MKIQALIEREICEKEKNESFVRTILRSKSHNECSTHTKEQQNNTFQSHHFCFYKINEKRFSYVYEVFERLKRYIEKERQVASHSFSHFPGCSMVLIPIETDYHQDKIRNTIFEQS